MKNTSYSGAAFVLRMGPDVALGILIILFAFPFFILGKFSVLVTHDNSEILISGLAALTRNGFSPDFWLPQSAAGADVLTLGYASVSNRFLFAAVPVWAASQILAVSQYLLAMTGAYLISNRVLKFDKWASLVPAVLFGLALDGQMITSVVAYQPMLLFTLTLLLDRPGDWRRWLMAAAMIFLITDTAFISRLVPFPAALVAAWFLIVDTRKSPLDWAIIAAALLTVTTGFRFPEIMALAVQAEQTHISLLRPILALEDILTVPVIFATPLNALCAASIAYALILGRGEMPKLVRLTVFIGIGVVFVPAIQIAQMALAGDFPFVQGYQFNRFINLTQLALWLGAGYGVAVLLGQWRASNDDPFRWRMWRIGQTGLFVVWLVLAGYMGSQKISQARDWITNGSYVHNFQSPVFSRVAAEAGKEPWPRRVESFQMYPTFLHPYGMETIGGYQPLFNRRIYEFWDALVSPWMDRLRKNPGGQYSGLLASGPLQKHTGAWPVYRGVRMNLNPFGHSPDWRLEDYYRANLMSLVNIGWILSRDRLSGPVLELIDGPGKAWSSLSTIGKLKVNFRGNFFGRKHVFVYRNRSAFPRFISPVHVRVYPDGQSVLAAMSNSTLDELRTTLYIAEGDRPKNLASEKKYRPLTISPLVYTSDRIDVAVAGDGEGLLLGLNAWTRDWRVRVDGTAADLFPADHAFWGVIVPKGAKKVSFRYTPRKDLTKRFMNKFKRKNSGRANEP